MIAIVLFFIGYFNRERIKRFVERMKEKREMY